MGNDGMMGEVQHRGGEGYPKNWKHCTLHFNPETEEMHSGGDHSVRTYVERLQQKCVECKGAFEKIKNMEYNYGDESFDMRETAKEILRRLFDDKQQGG